MSAKTLFLVALALFGSVALADKVDDDFESELESALAVESGLGAGWPAAFRAGRGRRENDAPFRMCGIELLQHVMDNNYCDTSRCARRKRSIDEPAAAAVAPFGSRSRRASSTLLTHMCCTNTCRPSQIQKVCCDGANRG